MKKLWQRIRERVYLHIGAVFFGLMLAFFGGIESGGAIVIGFLLAALSLLAAVFFWRMGGGFYCE